MNEQAVQVIFIARDSEKERIQFMQSWLDHESVSYQRINGVDVRSIDDLDRHYDRIARHARFGYDLTDGELGCFLAHRIAWLYCRDQKLPTLILENDVAPVYRGSLGNILDDVKQMIGGADMIRLSGIFEKNEIVCRHIMDGQNGYALKQCLQDPMGGGAYVITPFAADVLLTKSTPFYEALDVFLAANWRHRLRFRTIKPYPFAIKDFQSEIGERRRPQQSIITRLKIELNRAVDDLKRLIYMPINFFR